MLAPSQKPIPFWHWALIAAAIVFLLWLAAGDDAFVAGIFSGWRAP